MQRAGAGHHLYLRRDRFRRRGDGTGADPTGPGRRAPPGVGRAGAGAGAGGADRPPGGPGRGVGRWGAGGGGPAGAGGGASRPPRQGARDALPRPPRLRRHRAELRHRRARGLPPGEPLLLARLRAGMARLAGRRARPLRLRRGRGPDGHRLPGLHGGLQSPGPVQVHHQGKDRPGVDGEAGERGHRLGVDRRRRIARRRAALQPEAADQPAAGGHPGRR